MPRGEGRRRGGRGGRGVAGGVPGRLQGAAVDAALLHAVPKRHASSSTPLWQSCAAAVRGFRSFEYSDCEPRQSADRNGRSGAVCEWRINTVDPFEFTKSTDEFADAIPMLQ